MKEYEVNITYDEPRVAEVTVYADDSYEAETEALKQFEETHPEAINPEIDEVTELNA